MMPLDTLLLMIVSFTDLPGVCYTTHDLTTPNLTVYTVDLCFAFSMAPWKRPLQPAVTAYSVVALHLT